MSGFNLLNLGVQATNANKTALSVVGQNISNVNTEGYSRQITNFATVPSQSGVNIESINRITDDFLSRQLWADTASFNRTDIFADMAGELDDLLASGSTSISTAMDDYFKALQNAVDDPTSLPNRELFVAESEALVRRFNDLNTVVVRQNDKINDSLDSVSQQVTTLGSNIADLNNQIRLSVTAGKSANELRDQRDGLVEDLSTLIDVQVVRQDNDEFSVFVANGQPLVVGISSNEMITVSGDPDASKQALALVIAGNTVEITDRVNGGKAGGLLEYRNEVLDPAVNELGRIAIAFSATMNEQHQKGMDLDDNLGGLLFTDVNAASAMNSRLRVNEDNVSKVDTSYVRITDVSQLKASDYEITFNTADSLSIERLSDGKRFTLSDLTPVATSSNLTGQSNAYYADAAEGLMQISMDGFQLSIDVTSRFVAGDRFLVQPTRQGAADLGIVINDGRQLALASPVRVTTSPDNTGTGVAEVRVADINSPTFQRQSGALSPPVEVVFNSGTPKTYTVFDMTTPETPVPLQITGTGPLKDQIYTAGQPIELDGYQIEISNQPAAGDRFSFSYNTEGVSDNRNALAMSDLQLADTLEGGSYQDIYGRLIERVGTKTSVSVINREASKSVLTSTQESRSSLSGVNLDEEAAKLVQYQQAYQASAQLISASQTLFDTLLNSI
ncbi:MAG: flagellar hook-associated protein FlgK [Pontibacterium sp.]